jgi:hypothetical protein
VLIARRIVVLVVDGEQEWVLAQPGEAEWGDLEDGGIVHERKVGLIWTTGKILVQGDRSNHSFFKGFEYTLPIYRILTQENETGQEP